MLFLSKLRHFLDKKAQKSVYYAVFESHLWYASFVWARNTNSVKRLYLLLKKSLKIMLFQSQNSHTGPLFKDSKILRSFNKAALENCIFISKTFKGLLPSVYNNWFTFSFEPTRWANLGYPEIPSYLTKIYGRYLMIVKEICLESLTKLPSYFIFHQLSTNKLKEITITFFLSRYN